MPGFKSAVIITDAPLFHDPRSRRSMRLLKDLGYQVTVIDQGVDPERSRNYLLPDVKLLSSPVPPGKIQRMLWHIDNRVNPLGAYNKRTMWYRFVLEKLQPSLIYNVNVFSLEAAALAADELGVPFVYESYEYWPALLCAPEGRQPAVLIERLLEVEKKYAPQACLMVSVSPYLAAQYQQELDLEAEPLVLYSAPTEVTERIDDHAHVPLRLLFLGNLQPERNIKLIFEAAAEVSDVDLTFRGDGDLKGWLDHEIMSRELSGRIHVVPPVPYEEVVRCSSECDLGILAHTGKDIQLAGALPNKFFQYLAAGLAVIAPPTPAFQAFPEFDAFGRLLPDVSVEGLRSTLATLATAPKRVEAMKQAARIAAKDYCGDTQESKLIQAIERIKWS